MKSIHKIMAAVDFSEYALPLTAYAAQLAKDIGAELVLVNVFNQRDIDMLKKIDSAYPPFSSQKYFEENLQDRKNQLGALVEDSGCRKLGVKTRWVVRQGVPYQELLDEIQKQKADLLVIGTKGRSNLMDSIIGSCAHKIFRRSPIPVLSIRGKTK